MRMRMRMRMRMTWGMLELRTVSSVFGSGPVVCMLEDPPHTPKMISKTKLAPAASTAEHRPHLRARNL